MSAIVTGVLKLTFGFLVNKTRVGIAKRLQDGDITDEECRRLFVRELDDIKSKLDGLARKDLLSSLLFLQEGINGLYQSLFQLDSNEITAESGTQVTLVEATSSNDTGFDSVIDKAVALVNAMKSLKIRSNDRLTSAKKSFKRARENATEAFGNEALSIEDRIQASQIRMMARILEKLDDPDASVSDCLQYLKQLHDIGAIQEIFSVLIDGGVKSRFKKTKRLESAASVQLMNQMLFEFARKFTKLPLSFLDWPMIFFGKTSYHPVFGESRLVEKLEEFGVQVMSLNPDYIFNDKISPWLSVVNSKGEILALTQDESRLKIFNRLGESRTLCEVPREEHASEWKVTTMDIDGEDNIYIVTTFHKNVDILMSFKLLIFDENGNKKLEFPLPFRLSFIHEILMTVNKDGKIYFTFQFGERTLHIGKVCLEKNLVNFEKPFPLIDLPVPLLGYKKIMFADFSTANIVVADILWFYICTDYGKFKRKSGLIFGLDSVAINHAMKCILVKVNKSNTTRCTKLQSYSDTGKLMNSLNLGFKEWIEDAKLISHPKGPVALVGSTGATLLQL